MGIIAYCFYVGKILQWRSTKRSHIQLYNTILNMVCSVPVPPPLNISEKKKVLMTPKYLSNVVLQIPFQKTHPPFLGGDMQSFLDNNLP